VAGKERGPRGGEKVAVVDTSIVFFIHRRESPAPLAEQALNVLRGLGYRIVYPPIVRQEIRSREPSALSTLSRLAEPLRVAVDRGFVSRVDRWLAWLSAAAECKRRSLRPLYCGVSRGDIAVSLSTPFHEGVLVTGDRGLACFHASIRRGKALLVPHEL